jgi:PilZ domain
MHAACEGRREARVVCQGDVQLYFDNGGQESQAKLLDVSSNGFCATHTHPDLQPGREVRFSHLFFVGKARVVWTNVVAGRTQSGFQILRG